MSVENPVDRYIREQDARRAWMLREAARRAESERHAVAARYIARAARKSQAMPRNPIVLEPIRIMRDRAARARRQWVAAVIEVLRWAAT